MTTLALWPVGLLLIIASMDVAQAQAQTNEMWLRGNAEVTRNRVDSEIRKARDAGVIKRWSPNAIEIRLQPRPAVSEARLAGPLQGEPGVPRPQAGTAP